MTKVTELRGRLGPLPGGREGGCNPQLKQPAVGLVGSTGGREWC